MVSVAIIAVALGAGLIAVGIIGPSPFRPGPTNGPTARTFGNATANPSASEPASLPPVPSPIPAGDTAILVGAGDIADCERSEDELTADLVANIAGTVFTAGDNAYPDGSTRDFEDCYGPSWGRPDILGRTHPAPGDNEYDTPDAHGYFEYFGDAAGDPATGYYAYDAATWRVYVLNTNCSSIGGCGEGSAQAAWLLGDLSANPRDCVIAIWHHPYYTSGPSEGLSSAVRNLWRILHEADAEIVVSGHDNVYERFAPQDAETNPDPDGLVQFIVGTGGGDPDKFQTVAPNSVVRERGGYGVLLLQLRPESYAWEFDSVAGPQFTDTGTADCH